MTRFPITQRANPFKRTLRIFAVTVASAVFGFWFVGGQLVTAPRSAVAFPDDGPALEPVSVEAADGAILSGWQLSAGNPSAIVVLLHPVLADRTHMLSRARFLAAAGYGALMFDSRAHGESGGRRLTYGLLEAGDAAATVRFARKRFPGVPVVTLGISLGGGATLLAEPELKPDGMILESVFPDLETALANRLRMRLGQMGAYLAPLFAWQVRWRLDAVDEDFWAFKRARSVTVPVMVIAASADRRVTSELTLRFFELFESSKTIWLAGGAVHQDLHWFAGEEYERRVLAFVAGIAN